MFPFVGVDGLAQVREALVLRAQDFGIVLEDVAITHLAFSHEFTHAIESKQVQTKKKKKSNALVSHQKPGGSTRRREIKVSRHEGIHAEIKGKTPNSWFFYLQAEQEKEAAIIRAEGESEAAAMIAKVTFVICCFRFPYFVKIRP